MVSTDPHVVVRVHRPKGVDGPLPCIYSIHGGGYILGTYAMDDARFDRYCTMFPCVGVSVEYRLAPETPYPGPLEDCYAGLKWTYEHRDELGIDAGAARHRRDQRRRGPRRRARAARTRSRRGPAQLPAARVPDGVRPAGHVLEPARRASRSGAATRTSSAGAATSAISTAPTTSPSTPRPRVRPTCRDCRPRSSSSVAPTASATRTSTTRSGSTSAACRPSCTCFPARRTACRCSRARGSHAGGTSWSRAGWSSNCRNELGVRGVRARS